MKNPLSTESYSERTYKRDEDIRGDFFRDQTAIIHSMPFRRLKHKTQVFFSPENDHVCTRIEHVLHVAIIAATICKGLNQFDWDLNSEMAFAIGLGHDLGHAPFGHAGEEALNRKLGTDAKFVHEVNSYRVVQYLANDGRGLNLTYGVKDGIINHNGEAFHQSLKPTETANDLDSIVGRTHFACSYEGIIVRFSDTIAYLGRDIKDAILANFFKIDVVPEVIREDVGKTNGAIINSLIVDLIDHSKKSDEIGFSDEMYDRLVTLKKFNYKRIYKHPKILKYRKKGEAILEELFDYLGSLYIEYGTDYGKYSKNGNNIACRFGKYLQKMKGFYAEENTAPNIIVVDYIAGMTDNYALEAYRSIKLPEPIRF